MASNKSVVVLAPNGRRQNVKVTPNSTILQILEEVCKKQGYDPDEYDIKHHNHLLDTSTIMRFSGLPNNAQLEMCPALKIREDCPVTVGLQLESGTRITGNFSPSENLWYILTELSPEEANPDTNPVIVYMRQEVYGLENFKNTTLRSLGLTYGRAILRLIHKTPEELKTQANVSTPLPSKPVEEKPYIRRLQSEIPAETEPKDENCSPMQVQKEKGNFVTDFIKKEKSKKSSSPTREKISAVPEAMDVENTETPNKKENSREDELVFLGERNALAFSLEMAEAVPHEDLPDEFYELTIQDARKLFHDLKKQREELEETPLQTSALRNLEQSKKVLRHISQYSKSVIRVQFPDRTVLQGTFKPLETIQHILEFVKEYLDDSEMEFHLYTTPPKSILDPEKTLAEAECVPSAVVHFGSYSTIIEDMPFLRSDLFSKFISPSLASIAASKFRVKNTSHNPCPEDMEVPEMYMQESDDVNVGASTSKAMSPIPTSRTEEPREKQVPNWFQSAK